MGNAADRRRRVWLPRDDGKLECVPVEAGISDDSFTEIKAPTSLEGRQVVIGYASAASMRGSDETKNPFMPKMPKRNQNRGTAPKPRE